MEFQRLSARAVLVNNGDVLLIRRQRLGDEYYVLPGGGPEAGETSYDACRREIREETGLDVPELRYVETSQILEQSTRVLWARVESQKVRLGEIEVDRSSVDNRYELIWVAAETVAELALRPTELKELVIKAAQLAADSCSDGPSLVSRHAAG